MRGNKTIQNDGSVESFLSSIENERRKKDSYEALEMLSDLTNLEPKLWGDSIVGFGIYNYKYNSGREGQFFRAGFSPRKTSLTFYIMAGFPEYENMLAKLGQHKRGKSCLYINNLDKVDKTVLKTIISTSFHKVNDKYPSKEAT